MYIADFSAECHDGIVGCKNSKISNPLLLVVKEPYLLDYFVIFVAKAIAVNL
jgi:hypothetical protein